jgi:hypothetical protein
MIKKSKGEVCMGEPAKKTAKKQRKIPWQKLENEYISSKLSYKDLSDKYKVPKRQIERYASEHKWVQKRKEIVGEVSANVKKAIVQKETDKQIGKLDAIADAVDILRDEVLNALSDGKQLYTRSFYDTDKGQVIEYQTSKLDGGQLNQFVRALDKLTDIIRDVNDMARENQKVTVEFNMQGVMADYGK